MRYLLALVAMLLLATTFAAASAAAAPPRAVSTYQSIGLTWDPAGGTVDKAVTVQYRKQGTSTWKVGHPMTFDARPATAKVGEFGTQYGQQYRGSLVNLSPDTTYEIELTLVGGETQTLTAQTWAQVKPIARVIGVATRTTPLDVIYSGSPAGYVVYDCFGSTVPSINVKASYVIVRQCNVKGAPQNAITLEPGRTDVIIEKNNVSGWGRIAPDAGKNMDGTPRPAEQTWSFFWGEDGDSAIYCTRSSGQPTIDRIVVQNNQLHDPRSGSNSWSEPRPVSTNGHPYGPQAIYASQCGSNWVVRGNKIYSDSDHYFNDALGGAANFSDQGWPGADSDIYGNSISYSWDEAIEAEGANRNVRIWGNFTDKVFGSVAIAGTQIGPVYIWRNISDRSEARRAATTDGRSRGVFLKTGSRNTIFPGGGEIRVYNNTILQRAPEAGQTTPLGHGDGLVESGGATGNLHSRNNILAVTQPLKSSVMFTLAAPEPNTYDYDLYNGALTVPQSCMAPPEEHGIKGSATYDPGVAPFALATGSLGVDRGVVIPNFTDGFTGVAPDIGAHERGTSLPVFP